MNDISLDSKKGKRILSERAAKVSQKKIERLISAQNVLLIFNIGKQPYALDFAAIERVITEQDIRFVPGVDPLFSGLIYYNTSFWPVINLNQLLNCQQPNDENNFILLHDEDYQYALAIGKYIGQMHYNKNNEVIPLAGQSATEQSYLLGIYQADIAVLDISTILKLLKSISVTCKQ